MRFLFDFQCFLMQASHDSICQTTSSKLCKGKDVVFLCMIIQYLVQDLYPLKEQIHRWLQVLCGCKQKMVLAKWKGIKREGGGSPCDQRKNWISGTGRSRVLERQLQVFGIKSRCFLPLCHSSQGSSSAKRVCLVQVWSGHLFDVP